MDKKYVFLTLGFLGSGKSFVSRWLAPHISAVHLRTDDLRVAMFGTDRLELHTPQNKALVNNASRYALIQILKSSQAHVVQDANHNAKGVRRDIARDAAMHNAATIVVYVQTPIELAKRRTETRAITEGQQLFEANIVQKMAKRLEAPSPDELVILIDGQATAEEQQKSFDKQWAAIKQKNS